MYNGLFQVPGTHHAAIFPLNGAKAPNNPLDCLTRLYACDLTLVGISLFIRGSMLYQMPFRHVFANIALTKLTVFSWTVIPNKTIVPSPSINGGPRKSINNTLSKNAAR